MLPSALIRIIRHTPRLPDDNVASWLDDILMANVTREEHLTFTLKVLSRLLGAGLSVNFAKCIFGVVRQEFLGMIIDSSGIRPSPSKKVEAIEKMPPPSNVEELRAFLGMIGYMRQSTRNFSITAAALTDLLRIKEFASNKACKTPIAWRSGEARDFHSLKKVIISPAVLAFSDWNNTFIVQTAASSAGAEAVLMQPVGHEERVLAFASHRVLIVEALRNENVWLFYGPSNTLDSTWLVEVSPW